MLIESIDRALEILLLFLHEETEMSVTQISRTLGLHKSTVCRTLETLEHRGFIQQNPDNSKYWLGLQVYSLGMLFREKEPLKKIAYPCAKELAEKFNEGVHIITFFNNAAEQYPQHIMLEKIQSSQVLNLAPAVGSVGACHSSASGKCLLAFSTNEYLEPYIGCELPAFTKNTICDWNQLLDELKLIRQEGYAIDKEELEIGLICIAAPIFKRNQKVVAAISLSGPTSRIKKSAIPDIVREVKKTAQQISNLIQ